MAPIFTPCRRARRATFRILALLEIPQHVHRDGRAAAGERVHLAGVGQLVVHVDRGGVLKELAETRAGVGETPGGKKSD
jgi:hypothetical protein